MNISWQEYIQPEIIAMIKRHMTWISFTVACTIAALVSIEALASEGQPVVRVGKHCPSGYLVSGDYCVSRAGSNDTTAIEKKGSCPSGYRRSGDYCMPNAGQQDVPHIIEKKGPCPSGYKVSGQYCVERDR
jgi:hypothetical protein